MDNQDVSQRNIEFWNELCGSHLAKSLGIVDSSQDSLKKFDEWYFDLYPYLFKHIPFNQLRDKDVLEVGLGYGTVAQRLAESGARYSGLDIALGPVEMANHRLRQKGLPGHATQGNILDPPFDRESFDAIVAIGCLHHTGNLKVAIDNCRTLLRPGGKLIFMVYYAYSYRRWCNAFSTTFDYFKCETSGYRGVVGESAEGERAAYDTNSEGAGAPHTDWISIKSMKELCGNFSHFNASLENIDQEFPFRMIRRKKLLATPIPKVLGLDLYAEAVK